MRCADGRNHELVIVSLICQEAKQQHKQYTKRMLPWFVIPECNIRLDLMLNLLKLEERRKRVVNPGIYGGGGDGRAVGRSAR